MVTFKSFVNMPKFVYIVRSGDTNRYKIGKTKNIYQRFKKLNGTEAPFYITPIHYIQVINNTDIEKYLHIKYKKYKAKGEWFELNENLVKNVISDMNIKQVVQLAEELTSEELIELQIKIIELCKYKIPRNNERLNEQFRR